MGKALVWSFDLTKESDQTWAKIARMCFFGLDVSVVVVVVVVGRGGALILLNTRLASALLIHELLEMLRRSMRNVPWVQRVVAVPHILVAEAPTAIFHFYFSFDVGSDGSPSIELLQPRAKGGSRQRTVKYASALSRSRRVQPFPARATQRSSMRKS